MATAVKMSNVRPLSAPAGGISAIELLGIQISMLFLSFRFYTVLNLLLLNQGYSIFKWLRNFTQVKGEAA